MGLLIFDFGFLVGPLAASRPPAGAEVLVAPSAGAKPQAAVENQKSKLKNQKSAFTLVEVLVVIAIIGIAAGIVVPQMLRSGTLTVQAAGRSVIADLLYAQNEAIAQQSPRRVVFEIAENRYKLTDGAGAVLTVSWKGEAANNYIVNFSTDTRFAGVRIDSVDFGGETFIEYDDMGSPSTGGTVDLVASGVKYRTTVAPFTGRVTIAEVSP